MIPASLFELSIPSITLLSNCQPIVNQLSINCQPIVNQLSTNCQPIVNKLSVVSFRTDPTFVISKESNKIKVYKLSINCQLIVNQLSTSCQSIVKNFKIFKFSAKVLKTKLTKPNL